WYHIRLRNIINLESRAHKVILNMVNHSSIEAYGKLDWFEEEIQEDHRFVRIHKSTIVNGNYIRRISATEVELVNGKIYPISRTLHNKAKIQYDEYIEKYTY
ncbi:MAG: LytTR family transcriptional regulator DNA-binding domain-containing protein, partial [Lachnospiraceae bacterium]|nr:LytTR family transcriptional regulator DNA-binding domain-containing protein [Lachnospiraceae bacterium]